MAENSCNTVYCSDMVCFRYITVNTVHIGDYNDGDDDDDNLVHGSLTYKTENNIITIIKR